MPLIISPRQLTQRAQFYRQFGQLLGAGVSVLTALDLLSKNASARSFQKPAQQIMGQISDGANLTGAIRNLGQWLPDFDIALIEAGEHSGRLDTILTLLANYYDDRARILRQMLSDMAYPVLVLHLAVFIFPMVAVFQGDTWTMFCLKTFGVIIPIYALVFGFIFISQGSRALKWRDWLERVLSNVPVLGKARHALALSRLAAALEALTNAGVTLIEAWEMAAAACGSPTIHKVVRAWKPALMAGQTPAEAVRASPVFPEMFSNFYTTGEVSGQLDNNLRQLYLIYHEEGSRKMHFLSQWVPRALYFGIALYVAYKVVTFYLGYFNQLNQIMK